MNDTWNDYTEHRSRDDLNELLRYAHFIAVGKGHTQRYVEQHYPGWHWNELIAILRIGGVLQKGDGDRLQCDPRVRSVHFGKGSLFAVEWDWLGH